MKAIVFTALLAGTLLSVGCSSEKKGTELLETARFEEKQNNREHAVKLYEEIVRRFPDSQAAREAAMRLDALKQRKP
jgi:TolA-binding protein